MRSSDGISECSLSNSDGGGNELMLLSACERLLENIFSTLPAPAGIPYGEYGQPYRGQPSVVYSVPFTLGAAESDASSTSYAGYGDPTGATGVLNAPDATITTDTPGSGASRLQVNVGSSGDVVTLHARPGPLPPETFTLEFEHGTSTIMSAKPEAAAAPETRW